MYVHPIGRHSVLIVAVLLAAVAVGGCSGTVPFVIPNPTSVVPTPTGTPSVPGGGGGTDLLGASPGSPGIVTSQNPALRALALANRYANVTIGGCVKPGSVPVPDITNTPLAQAQGTLLLQGFTVGNIRWAYSATVPPGNVISQDPGAGKLVQPDTPINLLCSLGPQLAAVPDVAGRPQAEAEAAITGAGFAVDTVAQDYHATVPAGSVISQDPTAGTLAPPDTVVNLVVSRGPQPVAVPDVLGKTQPDAEAALAGAGLSLGSVAQGSSGTVPAGSVMSQNPPPGSLALPGSPVDLVVSQGPQPVPVPNIVGRAQSDARATITGAGFSVGAVTEDWSATVPAGSVIGQDPAAGTVMIPGTAVNFVVSKGPAPVPTPHVVGMSQTNAQTAITGAGLAVGTVTQEYSATVAEGGVISQSPTGGTMLTPGSLVNLVVAKSTLSLCDYYPFAVGNKWVTAANNGVSSEITDSFIINGCQCWKFTIIDHAANDNTTFTYAAETGGWVYNYKVLDDLFLLPGIAASAQKLAPTSFKPGDSITTTFNGTTFTVTTAKGKLSDFVSNVSACPLGDVQDTVALKLGNFVVVVFGRNLGPIYYNYLTSSGFYSTVSIVGGCGVNQ